VEDWVGLAVKKDTPDHIVVRLNKAINGVLGKPNVRDTFAKLGAEPAGGMITAQVAHWKKIVKDSGIKIQQ
jgi:tripartite-type tricarboxylate transporter receptor subunit TctC